MARGLSRQDSFQSRLVTAGIDPKDIAIFQMEERTNPLALHCLPQDLLRERDNIELAVRMVINLPINTKMGIRTLRLPRLDQYWSLFLEKLRFAS